MALAKLQNNDLDDEIRRIEQEAEEVEEKIAEISLQGSTDDDASDFQLQDLVNAKVEIAEEKENTEEEDEEAKRNEYQRLQEELKKKTPEELFMQFDTDGSGLIDFDEFRALLPQIGIKMSSAKTLKYFKMCDTDGSGEIDFDEFKTALYALDPDSGNPVGFRPNSFITPQDCFEMFDEHNTGKIDEDQFFFVLEFMGLSVTDQEQEKLFLKYDSDASGYIEYPEFKQIWLRVCDVRKELENRGLRVPKVVMKAQLINMLGKMLDEEEEREKQAIAEAKRWREWQKTLKAKRFAMAKARFRADLELRTALDAAGQVYVFGAGSEDQLLADAIKKLKAGSEEMFHFKKISDEWRKRIKLGNVPIMVQGKARRDGTYEKPPEMINWFSNINAAVNTCALWGRRVVQVAAGNSVVYGLSDQGEIYAWGGRNHWWFQLEAESIFQKQWRGDITPRSQLMLGIKNKLEPLEEQQKETIDWEEQEAEKLKIITQYFKVWKPAPGGTVRLIFLKTEIMPKIPYEELKQACEVRGRYSEGQTRMQLVDVLHEDLLLERRVLGQRAHRKIRQLEDDIISLKKKNRQLLAKRLIMEIEEIWAPLREVRAEEAAEAAIRRQIEQQEKYVTEEQDYIRWREFIKGARSDHEPKLTSRGRAIDLNISAITERGGGVHTPRSYQAIKQIACGAQHVVALHQSGELYSWGLGISGRLGVDVNENGNPQTDSNKPALVQGLKGRPVQHIAAGFSHTAAVVAGGDLFIWGSAQSGKLGLGDIHDVECYCSLPTRVPIERRIKKVACGSAHTAAIDVNGCLYVWGCGDGGRLGLGPDSFETQYFPRLVESLKGLKISGVACGNSHTLARSVVEETYEGTGLTKLKKLQGGFLYSAGSAHVLGYPAPSFKIVPGTKNLVVRQCSAGFSHSAFVTADGEMYSWGQNKDGCCGLPTNIVFATKATFVPCMFRKPFNLAFGKPARQSSVYNDQQAHLAVDGVCVKPSGDNCCHTQQDPQAFWEVDLEESATIHFIKIWNRIDEPEDHSMERAYFSKRLFPCWAMVSREPFGDEMGALGLQHAMDYSLAKQRFIKDQQVTTWKCPDNTVARYVRIQIEGFNFLHLAQVEVYGNIGDQRSFGRVSRVECGHHMTAAIIKPLSDPKDISEAYKKAVQADSMNADILRQLETYLPFYDKYGRGDNLTRTCLICKSFGGGLCEVCNLKLTYREELSRIELGPGGRLRRLDSIGEFLYNVEKPKLDYEPPAKKQGFVTSAISSIKNRLKKALAEEKQTSEMWEKMVKFKEPEDDEPSEEEEVEEESRVPETNASSEHRKQKAKIRAALQRKKQL